MQQPRVDNDRACVICTEVFNMHDDRGPLRPKVLPCFHVFCATCIFRFNGECALCRRPFTLPAPGGHAGILLLPEPWDLIHEALTLASVAGDDDSDSAGARATERPTSVLLCECAAAPAVAQCEPCDNQLFCKSCLLAHSKIKSTKDHIPTALVASLAVPPAVPLSPLSTPAVCHVHPTQQLLFFCTEDHAVFCAHCFPISIHRSHNVISVPDAVVATTEWRQTVVTEARQAALMLAGAAGLVRQNAEALATRSGILSVAIEAHRVALTAAIDARCDALRRRVAGLCDRKLKQLTAQGDVLDVTQSGLTSGARTVEFLQSTAAHARLLAASQSLSMLVASVAQQQLSLIPVEGDDVEYQGDPAAVEHAVAMFGRVWALGPAAAHTTANVPERAFVHNVWSVIVTTHDDGGRRCLIGGDSALLTVLTQMDNTQGVPVPAPVVAVTDGRDGTYTVAVTPPAEGALSVAIMFRAQHIRGSPFTTTVWPCFVYDGPASQILSLPMEATLRAMLPRAPRALRLVHDSARGLTGEAFYAAVRGQGATLTVIRTTKAFVLGAVVFDALGGIDGGGRYIPGHADNFLFNIDSPANVAPVKLLKDAGSQTGLRVGQASYGLTIGGGNDLRTFSKTAQSFCNPGSFKTVAPGYPPVPVTHATLAGASTWMPDRIEVYALVF